MIQIYGEPTCPRDETQKMEKISNNWLYFEFSYTLQICVLLKIIIKNFPHSFSRHTYLCI